MADRERGDSRWRRYLRVWGPDPAEDVADELQFHLDERAAFNESRGLEPDRARAAAEERFGDVERIREECMMEQERERRKMHAGEHIGDALRDVRMALRSLRRAPLYALTAGLALALGIGASAAVFTMVRAVLLRPLPYGTPERVVAVHNRWDGSPQAGLSPAEYLDLAAQVRAFEEFGVYTGGWVNLQGDDGAERVPAASVTPGALAALGAGAAGGRIFDPSEGATGAAPVVMLSHDFWRARFGGSSDIIGRTLTVDGERATVVGVLPEGVRLPASYADATPPALFLAFDIDPAEVSARGSHFLSGVARLAPGWTPATAGEEVARVARQMVTSYPDDYPPGMRFETFLRPVHADVVADSRSLLFMLSGAVVLVLLVACANVSSLVLTRTEDRRRELAVRSALGAGQLRIARQLLIEQLVLALAAAAAGILIAQLAVTGLLRLEPDIPRLADVRVDSVAVAFAVGVAVLATLLAGLAPLRLSGPSHDALREAGARTTATRASQRTRRVLIGAEVALSVVLLAGAGLLLRSFSNLLAVDPGYRTEQVLSVPISLPTTSYPDSESRRRFFAQLIDDAASLPGVTAAGAASNLPLASGVGDINIQIEGRETPPGEVAAKLDWQVVTPGWLEAMGVETIRGRTIERSDRADGMGVVVLSESAAQQYWPDEDPIGQRFTLGGNAGPGMVTVIGVVRDVRQSTLADKPPPLMYLAHNQFTFWNGGSAPASLTLVLHTTGAPLALVNPLRERVRRIDSAVPLGAPRTMAQVRRASVAEPRFAVSILGSFAAVALVLAMIGVYGLVSYTVARRTREIAVRMALGADARGVVGHIVSQAMRPVLAGAIIGCAAALLLADSLAHMLYGIAPTDAGTLTITLVALIGTALLACVLPARRATRIAPFVALSGD